MHAPLHRILAVSLLAALVAILYPGCASTKTVAPGYEQHALSLGEDSYYELSASNLTRGMVDNQAPPVIVLNAKGNKVLAAIPSDPLAGVLTAQNLNVKVGKNQSNAFGKAMGTLNNWILGWVTNTASNNALASRQSDNILKAKQATEATRQTEILTAPTKYLPVEGEAISRASDSGIKPFIP